MAGPLSPTTTFSKVKTPNDIQIPNSSVFENLGVGTRQGLQETTLAYAKEINLLPFKGNEIFLLMFSIEFEP